MLRHRADCKVSVAVTRTTSSSPPRASSEAAEGAGISLGDFFLCGKTEKTVADPFWTLFCVFLGFCIYGGLYVDTHDFGEYN